MVVKYVLHTGRTAEGAAYNRIKMLCKGLQEHNIKSELLVYKSSPFPNSIIKKLWMLKILFQMILVLISLSKEDVIIIYGENHFLKYLLKLPRKAKLLVERNEYSTYLIRENLSDKEVAAMKYFEWLLAECDGMIVCSDFLKDYYAQFTSAPIVVLPLVVDINQFEIAHSSPMPYIAYCGDFGGNKDGLPTLLKAFAIISPKHPSFNLYLIGDTKEDATMTLLKKYVTQLNVADKVVFTGRIPHSEMPGLLCKASLLVLARPANKQAEGGIPSKLGEYLATGRPTLVTNVGELHKYFEDNKDLFFAKADSIDDFANKIDFILSNYEYAIKIGIHGAKKIGQFNYYEQSEILINYISNDV